MLVDQGQYHILIFSGPFFQLKRTLPGSDNVTSAHLTNHLISALSPWIFSVEYYNIECLGWFFESLKIPPCIGDTAKIFEGNGSMYVLVCSYLILSSAEIVVEIHDSSPPGAASIILIEIIYHPIIELKSSKCHLVFHKSRSNFMIVLYCGRYLSWQLCAKSRSRRISHRCRFIIKIRIF